MLFDDILITIFGFLDSPFDLVRCERVCRDWNRCSTFPALWKKMYERDLNPWGGLKSSPTNEFREFYSINQNLLKKLEVLGNQQPSDESGKLVWTSAMTITPPRGQGGAAVVVSEYSCIVISASDILKYDCKSGHLIDQKQLPAGWRIHQNGFGALLWRITENGSYMYQFYDNMCIIVDSQSLDVHEVILPFAPSSLILTSSSILVATTPENTQSRITCYKMIGSNWQDSIANPRWTKVVNLPNLRFQEAACEIGIATSADGFLGTMKMFYSIDLASGERIVALQGSVMTSARLHLINGDTCTMIQEEKRGLKVSFVNVTSGKETNNAFIRISNPLEKRIRRVQGSVFMAQVSMFHRNPWSLLVLRPYQGGQLFIPMALSSASLWNRVFSIENGSLYYYDVHSQGLTKYRLV